MPNELKICDASIQNTKTRTRVDKKTLKLRLLTCRNIERAKDEQTMLKLIARLIAAYHRPLCHVEIREDADNRAADQNKRDIAAENRQLEGIIRFLIKS